MRIMLAVPLLLLSACQVSKDSNNGTASVTYNGEVAANAANDISAKASTIAADISNDVKAEGSRAKARIDNTNLDVKIGKDDDTKSTTTTTTTTTHNKSN